MSSQEIYRAIQTLPVTQRIWIIQQTLRKLKQQQLKKELEQAVDMVMEDYQTDKELTAFTDIDFEDFYEPR